MPTRSQVFISYSHADSEHLLRLKVHLRPYERQSQIDLWSDTKIKTGQQWKKEIETALNRAAVAILLVSADFLASDFVVENELPPLLAAAQNDGVKILPVILKPCAFADVESLSVYQAVNDPAHPLISVGEADREAIWVRLAKEVNLSVQDFKALAAAEGKISGKEESRDSIFDDFQWAQELIREEVDNPSTILKYSVYEYQHVDILEFMPLAERVLQGLKNADEILNAVRERFTKAGWEGDGEIRLLWIPPFVGAGIEDTWGVAIWFVKQSNNGTSFMASPVPLPFSRLLEQQF